MFAIIGLDSANAETKVKSPAPFYAEYRIEHFKSTILTVKDKQYADKMEKQTYREYIAKGYPEKDARIYGKSLGDALRKTCSEKRVSVYVLGSNGNSILFGDKWKDGRNSFTVVKPDRVYSWEAWVKKGGIEHPAVRIIPFDPKDESSKVVRWEGIIFGFEPLEWRIFVHGTPANTKHSNGDTVYYESLKRGNATGLTTVVFDKYGRFTTSSFNITRQNEDVSLITWIASNYIKCNQGWIPKTIIRKNYENQLLTDWDYYHLDNLETNGPVFDRWFGDKVPEPAFVDDSRFDPKVLYFTRNKFLSDEEVKRRSEALASQDRPLSKPSPMKIVGVLLILIGAAVFIRRIGWPNKASSIDSNQEEKKQE